MTFFKPFLIAATAMLLFTSCSNENNTEELILNESLTALNKSAITPIEFNEFETQLIKVINDHRESIGVNPLLASLEANIQAESHTNYMIEKGEISHDNFNKREQNLIVNANAEKVGENVAFGYDSPEAVLEGWLNSSSHKRLIESSSYSHFGLCTNSGVTGKQYFTHIFIKI
ncbi:Cysteine-rich secretory protein family protein [Lutibacter oricola]|uniref:Cysteine-rich secretory protein family protein n=1 Tax=Lutibacter oricola TaxID=762486 RepID=A0A1H2XKY9_9FLAO|nr:CAP domain-containing protein [Lutibacter oricola]SDW92959.1 Cysteine-rich secretory protein family protein [Lutibacter oricola]